MYGQLERVCQQVSDTSFIKYCTYDFVESGKGSTPRYKCKFCKKYFGYNKKGKNYHPYFYTRIVQLYLEGIPIKIIARIVGISYTSILKFLNKIRSYTPMRSNLRFRDEVNIITNKHELNRSKSRPFLPDSRHSLVINDTHICLKVLRSGWLRKVKPSWYPDKNEVHDLEFSTFLGHLKSVRAVQLYLDGFKEEDIKKFLKLTETEWRRIMDRKFEEMTRLGFDRIILDQSGEYGEFIRPIIGHGRSEINQCNHNEPSFSASLRMQNRITSIKSKHRLYINIPELKKHKTRYV